MPPADDGATFAHDGVFWRRMAAMGARRFPRWWMRYSPPVFGLAAALALPDARKSVLRNLERIRGPASRHRDWIDTAATFSNYASALTEALAQGSDNGSDLRATYVRNELFREAVSRGKGVLLLTLHTAGWEIATPFVVDDVALDVLIVMQRERSGSAQELHDETRTVSSRTSVLHLGDSELAALPIAKHLAKKGAVAMQIDRAPPSGRTITVDLLGRPYAIPEGPLRIAELSGAPMLPVFSARAGFNDYVLENYAPIDLPRRATAAERQRAAQEIANAMGDFLTRHPTQWFHFGA